MDIAIHVGTQSALNWPTWQGIARAAEDLGFVALFRSDDLSNPDEALHNAIEMWTSFAWLASNSTRIKFGPLVSPLSFRNPVLTAYIATSIDLLSNGRVELGLGAGWQEREHQTYGFHLLAPADRIQRFEEGVRVVASLLRNRSPVTFHGRFFRMDNATLPVRPFRRLGPPIIVGGGSSVLPVAAKYADEWNADSVSQRAFARLNSQLNSLLGLVSRPQEQVRRSLLARVILTTTEKTPPSSHSQRQNSAIPRREELIVGSPGEINDQIECLAEIGLDRLIVQWPDTGDLAGLETLARALIA